MKPEENNRENNISDSNVNSEEYYKEVYDVDIPLEDYKYIMSHNLTIMAFAKLWEKYGDLISEDNAKHEGFDFISPFKLNTISKLNHINSQKALWSQRTGGIYYKLFSTCEEQITSAFNHVKEVINSSLYKTINKDVNLENISIFLVNKNLHNEDLEDVKAGIPGNPRQYNRCLEPLEWSDLPDKEKRHGRIISAIDLLGCYRPYDKVIFLWVDVIKEAVLEHLPAYSFEQLFAQVLLHELTHAMMDVDGEHKIQDSSFYQCMEESLANGMSLYALRKAYGDDVANNIADEFVKNQPVAYQMGLFYQTEDALKEAIPEWIKMKKDPTSVTDEDIDAWFNEMYNKHNDSNIN